MLKKLLIIGGLVVLAALPMVVLKLIPEERASKLEAPKLFWKDLRALDLKYNHIPSFLKDLQGKEVQVPGFVIPLMDEARKIKEFILVPTPMACIHVPAPPPNQIVHVSLSKEIEVGDLYRPVWVSGILSIEEVKMIYGRANYRITEAHVRPYKREL